MTKADQVQFIKPDWDAPANVVALSTNRLGGTSLGCYQSLNLGRHVGDEPESVAENRARLTKSAGLVRSPYWLDQVHGTRILTVGSAESGTISEGLENGAPLDGSPAPRADGAITSVANTVCVVMTADCMPLLLCNRSGTKVAALHVGWRGMAAGIIEHGCHLFNEPAEQLLAWAGPTIGPTQFEVGLEVQQQLGGHLSHYQPRSDPSKLLANLYGLAGERLSNLGVKDFTYADECTYSNSDYFSYRRDGITGRQATLIYLSV